MTQPPLFSIIIPTLNEEKYLPLLLADLAAQSYSHFEVHVVDCHSSDKTTTVAAAFSEHFPLSIYTVAPRNVSYQRNFGASKARGTWLIFMDADDRLPTYFLLGIAYKIERESRLDAFTTWVESSSHPTQSAALIARAYNLGITAYLFLKKPTAVGAMIGVRQEVFAKVKFRRSRELFEDHDFIERLFQRGYHFSIFREPTYTYSQRRFKKEGTFKMITTMVKLNLSSLLGDMGNWSEEYPMPGGTYYAEDIQREHTDYISQLQSFLQQTPKRELERLRASFTKLRESL
jgi:glycosyltransferase involved in cell wall biosynthesis